MHAIPVSRESWSVELSFLLTRKETFSGLCTAGFRCLKRLNKPVAEYGAYAVVGHIDHGPGVLLRDLILSQVGNLLLLIAAPDLQKIYSRMRRLRSVVEMMKTL